MKIYDILIIGAGPIGICCALEAKKNNFSYLVLEKGVMINSIYNYPQNMKFFSTAEKLEIANVPFISNDIKPNRKEALEYYQGIARSENLDINLYEKVEKISKCAEIFDVETIKDSYLAKNVVIATGFYDIPKMTHVQGEYLEKVKHYYSDPYPYVYQNVVVVGAGNSAVDAALEIYRKGARVTMIIKDDKISDRVKYWVRPDIENRIKNGEITAFFNSQLVKIKEHSVIFTDGNGQVQEIENDFVLAMTGYLPDFEFLQKSGVRLEGEYRKPVYNEDTMETNVQGLYLAGVVCGGTDTHRWFIENSRCHARKIINDIITKKSL